ncbi:unnamed protein product [Linum tenue]|uniref:Ubiquitin-like domain-containing protein n=1 Tax=Linum tenue TaxID=586396 RepID=A0AAV0GN84_9ROSI|nr:unnamed protein product [Linum tenue]CAI0437575.1 unnamed protein product [Linum tenue]
MDQESRSIIVKVRNQAGSSMRFRIDPATQLRGLMLSYCDWNELVADDVRFSCNGRNLHREDTPKLVRMKEGDVIDAVQVMDQEGPKKILVFLKAMDGRPPTPFRMNQATPFVKLMQAYCDQMGMEVDQIRFIYKGRRLDSDVTPQQVNMEDDDVIDVVLRLRGS